MSRFQVHKLNEELFDAKNRVQFLEQGSSAMAAMLKETQDHLNTVKHKMNLLLVR